MEIECTHCGTTMSRTRGAGDNVYFSCPRCARTIASMYDEAIRRGAGVRTVRPAAPPRPRTVEDERFDRAKARLDDWIKRLDDADPYHVLGVRPGAPLEWIRARYHELALRHHPDRGGDPREMRRIAGAYEKLRSKLVPRTAQPGARALVRPGAAVSSHGSKGAIRSAPR